MTDLPEALHRVFGFTVDHNHTATEPCADEGPDRDPWAADDRALDQRAHDRTTEVFDA